MCRCQVCRDKPEPYIRLCFKCGQFHNWRLLADGTAQCGNCGTLHPPLVRGTFGDVKGTFSDKSNCYQPAPAAEGADHAR
jgi:hypothetical protein